LWKTWFLSFRKDAHPTWLSDYTGVLATRRECFWCVKRLLRPENDIAASGSRWLQISKSQREILNQHPQRHIKKNFQTSGASSHLQWRKEINQRVRKWKCWVKNAKREMLKPTRRRGEARRGECHSRPFWTSHRSISRQWYEDILWLLPPPPLDLDIASKNRRSQHHHFEKKGKATKRTALTLSSARWWSSEIFMLALFKRQWREEAESKILTK
jgi:hypothetical protein